MSAHTLVRNRRLRTDERGQAMIEYALLALLLILASIYGLNSLKRSATPLFANLNNNLTQAPPAVGGGSSGGGAGTCPVSPLGAFSIYAPPLNTSFKATVVSGGPSGDVWAIVTNDTSYAATLVDIDPATGTVKRQVSLPGGGVGTTFETLSVGASNDLWAASDNNGVGEIYHVYLVSGVLTVTSRATTDIIRQMVPGSDGNIWGLSNSGYFRIHPSPFTLTDYAWVPNSFPDGDSPQGYEMVAGPDGRLWVTSNSSPGNYSYVGAFSPATPTTLSWYRLPPNIPESGTTGITAGPDGAIWVTGGNNGSSGPVPSDLFRITTAGAVSTFHMSGGGVQRQSGADWQITSTTKGLWWPNDHLNSAAPSWVCAAPGTTSPTSDYDSPPLLLATTALVADISGKYLWGLIDDSGATACASPYTCLVRMTIA